MDSYPIKSVAFGGFDKQDVIQYIEQAAGQAAAAQKALQDENEALRAENETIRKELDALQTKLQEASTQAEALQSALQRESAARTELEKLKPLEAETDRLRQEVNALRPDAQAYAQFRERIGAIECEARERAAELETATAKQLKQTVDLFRAQYQTLMSTFETTANHVNSELRKVEVNLTQLPRAMDPSSAALNDLAGKLERSLNPEK